METSKRGPMLPSNKVRVASHRSLKFADKHAILFGFLAPTLPAAHIIDELVGNPYYDTLPVRLISGLIVAPLIWYKTLSARFGEKLHFYWAFLIAVAFPFAFGHMLLMNAALAPNGVEIEMFWILQYVIALFLFIQLTNDIRLTLLLWSLAMLAAFLPIMFLDEVNWNEIQRVAVDPATAYLTALIFGVFFNRNIEIVNTEKIWTATAIGGHIAHELRTPLAGIRSYARGLKKHLPGLIEGYRIAHEAGLLDNQPRMRSLRGVEDALSAIEREVEFSNTIINMLLVSTSTNFRRSSESELFYSETCISDAIIRFPFNNSKERTLIKTDIKKNFQIQAPKILITHVLFNLIKNSIIHGQKRSDVSIVIKSSVRNGAGRIEVTDNGPGISEADRKRIFERFYTTTEAGQGTGIGLTYCKSVMESIGGGITCESKPYDRTVFSLVFPKAN